MFFMFGHVEAEAFDFCADSCCYSLIYKEEGNHGNNRTPGNCHEHAEPFIFSRSLSLPAGVVAPSRDPK